MTDEEIKKEEETAPEASSAEAPLETPTEETPPPEAPLETPQEAQSQPEQPPSPPAEPPPPPQAQAPADSSFLRQLLTKAKEKISSRREKKLEKIIAYLNERGKITNDEVQKLAKVSDATATRYLETLVKRGLIKKVGTTGRFIIYQKI